MDNTQFNQLPTTRIGDIAEEYIYNWLITGGTVNMTYVYSNLGTKSHPFDFVCYSADTANTKFLGDVKVKYERADGTMSIHQKDLDKYMEWAKRENCKFLLFYVNHKTGDINAITPETILKNGKATWDNQEYKWLVYFTGWRKIGKLPEEIRIQMNNISKKITNGK